MFGTAFGNLVSWILRGGGFMREGVLCVGFVCMYVCSSNAVRGFQDMRIYSDLLLVFFVSAWFCLCVFLALCGGFGGMWCGVVCCRVL